MRLVIFPFLSMLHKQRLVICLIQKDTTSFSKDPEVSHQTITYFLFIRKIREDREVEYSFSRWQRRSRSFKPKNPWPRANLGCCNKTWDESWLTTRGRDLITPILKDQPFLGFYLFNKLVQVSAFLLCNRIQYVVTVK